MSDVSAGHLRFLIAFETNVAGSFSTSELFFDFKLANRLNTALRVENMELCEESRYRVYIRASHV